MDFEREDCYRDLHTLQDLQDKCRRCLHYHVTLTMTDGNIFDGIIEDVDTNHINVLVGEDAMEQENENQFDQQRQYHDQRRPRRRFRRFRRRSIPFNTLATLSLLSYPYITQPPYPYYPYYPY
ncbi:hypothetical protein [Clostridium uliginosum]|uniref:Uncharacterized protein n=1 Tax=Clostridium uliginosum TaxID=119641 RepID=A0A1I1NWX1_9CLOT|nr:hypothetical protein [Clostridium uliginosum]SFD01832.1 hypothetical protein SAMN05421842_11714 [Clostridium uliginosum]